MAKLRIDDIGIGNRSRGRTELGDIDGLAKSIQAVGLLHPVVVTAEHELVAGERRIAAVRQLGWTEVPVTIVDLESAADVLRAELEENTCRKSLSAYEADVIRQRREEVLRPAAKESQGARSDLQPSPILGEGSRKDLRTAKVAAVGTGYSGSTLDKVRTIRDAAERGVVKQGKTELPAPEQVVAVAKEAAEKVKQTGAAIDREYQLVTQAIGAYVEMDDGVRRARKLKEWGDVLRATQGFRAFDFSVLADLLSAEDRATDDLIVASIERAAAEYRKTQPRGLRVVGRENK